MDSTSNGMNNTTPTSSTQSLGIANGGKNPI